LDDACRAAEMVRPVPGRFEAVPNDQGIGILVDYAHTPDALEKLLEAVRPLTQGRVITVFGCGGDRDRSKRPRMAKAASERSDVTVVTSDNPRTEDPQAILNEVLAGIVPGRESVDIIDRREAIAHAVKIAQPGDVVVIAGKGHENYQIIGRTKYPMDDRELAREALAAR
jgi:UDP-N-acetylmuramoyl-L-alanyl-D-glutamate--2,6-diaminopimelate ligase